ncbi:MAG: TlyA family RNA methyltransferase [Filomicrobium sp.]
MTSSKRQRLDQELVRRGMVQSRSRARDLVARGAVWVAGMVAAKAGQLVDAATSIEIDEEANAYVARSGAKLLAGLREFGFGCDGVTALDIGASTGGFTQVLLESGAARVYAVDVGQDQLDESLLEDQRVVVLEGQDARKLTASHVPERVGAIVIDVSFISVTKVLPHIDKFAGPQCWLVALVKPQFELGREALGKGGVVRDADAGLMACENVRVVLEGLGWQVTETIASPLPGKKGNVEFLLGAQRIGGGV